MKDNWTKERGKTKTPRLLPACKLLFETGRDYFECLFQTGLRDCL